MVYAVYGIVKWVVTLLGNQWLPEYYFFEFSNAIHLPWRDVSSVAEGITRAIFRGIHELCLVRSLPHVCTTSNGRWRHIIDVTAELFMSKDCHGWLRLIPPLLPKSKPSLSFSHADSSCCIALRIFSHHEQDRHRLLWDSSCILQILSVSFPKSERNHDFLLWWGMYRRHLCLDPGLSVLVMVAVASVGVILDSRNVLVSWAILDIHSNKSCLANTFIALPHNLQPWCAVHRWCYRLCSITFLSLSSLAIEGRNWGYGVWRRWADVYLSLSLWR